MTMEVHDDFAGVEACCFGEGVELFGGRGVGGAFGDLVAVGDSYRHSSFYTSSM